MDPKTYAKKFPNRYIYLPHEERRSNAMFG